MREIEFPPTNTNFENKPKRFKVCSEYLHGTCVSMFLDEERLFVVASISEVQLFDAFSFEKLDTLDLGYLEIKREPYLI